MFSKVIYSKKTRAKKKAKKAAKKAAASAAEREAYLADCALKGEGLLAMATPFLEGSVGMASLLANLAEVSAAQARKEAQEAELAAAK